jgi:predicted small secreted protein
MKRTIAALLLATFGFALAGCNTMNGAGKDVERAGEKIQDASKK